MLNFLTVFGVMCNKGNITACATTTNTHRAPRVRPHTRPKDRDRVRQLACVLGQQQNGAGQGPCHCAELRYACLFKTFMHMHLKRNSLIHLACVSVCLCLCLRLRLRLCLCLCLCLCVCVQRLRGRFTCMCKLGGSTRAHSAATKNWFAGGAI